MSFVEKVQLPENSTSAQKEAWGNFETLGFPTIKNEEWKFTNVSRLIKESFDQVDDADLSTADFESANIDGLDALAIPMVNGQLLKAPADLSSGLFISSLKQALSDNRPEVVEKYGTATRIETDSFSALSSALSEDGIYIHVAKGAAIEKPIHVQWFFDAQEVDTVAYPRVLIIAEENSEVRIINTYHTIGSKKSFSIEVGEIFVAKDARVYYDKVQNDTSSASHIGSTEVVQEGKSFFHANTVTLDGELIRNNLNLQLGGEYIESHMNGLYMVAGDTHVDNHTIADHQYPHCESHELYKGILADNSRGVFNGKIYVRKDAQKTNAFQSNKNILLSDDAKINTKPQLEIWADDVSCSHGCTTGQLDEEALFYLKARGIGDMKAKALLVEAFAGDVIARVKNEALRTYLLGQIVDRLNKA